MVASPIMNIITQATRKAAKIYMRDFGEIQNLQTSTNSVKYFTDKSKNKVQEILIAEITKAYPKNGIICDNYYKDTDNPEDGVWIINALDGEENFSRAIPYFSLSVAYKKNNVITDGIVYNPATDDFFMAEKGKGASLNGKRIRVSSMESINNCMISIRKYDDLLTIANKKLYHNLDTEGTNIRSFGSPSIDIVRVASGNIDAYIQSNNSLITLAASILILLESGGRITDFSGENKWIENKQIIVSNDSIHNEIINRMNKE
jgi:myo-inositol-1(or 4)-monophosphatase